MKSFFSSASLSGSRFKFRSISFSGAGFLGVYHCGVYACLLNHGYLLRPFERIENDTIIIKPPILTGVSAGALISVAISCGVSPDNIMNVCHDVASRTKKHGGVLDVLKPGFSLIDTLEFSLLSEMQKALGGSEDSDSDYDNDLLMNRIQNGRLLRIGLTDRSKVNFTSLRSDLSAYVYADTYRDIHDITSAAILSSYIPVGTGPLSIKLGQINNNLAIVRAWKKVKEMENIGCLKHGISSLPVKTNIGILAEDSGTDEPRYIDGGISNICPEIDDETLIVCPMNGFYGNRSISPNHPKEGVISQYDEKYNLEPAVYKVLKALSIPNLLHINEKVKFGLNSENLLTAYLMARSSEPTLLDQRFQFGYDDAHRFLNNNGLLTVFSG